MPEQTPAEFVTSIYQPRESTPEEFRIISLARAALRIGAHLSLQSEWNSETPEQVAEILHYAHATATGTTVSEDDAQAFWIANAGAVGFSAEDYGHETPPTLHFSGSDPEDEERAELTAAYREWQAARDGDSNDSEHQSAQGFIEALMRFAQIEEA